MTEIFLGSPSNPVDPVAFARWVQDSMNEIEKYSRTDASAVIINFNTTGTFTRTRTLNVETPTLENVVAFLATMIEDIQNSGTADMRG